MLKILCWLKNKFQLKDFFAPVAIIFFRNFAEKTFKDELIFSGTKETNDELEKRCHENVSLCRKKWAVAFFQIIGIILIFIAILTLIFNWDEALEALQLPIFWSITFGYLAVIARIEGSDLNKIETIDASAYPERANKNLFRFLSLLSFLLAAISLTSFHAQSGKINPEGITKFSFATDRIGNTKN